LQQTKQQSKRIPSQISNLKISHQLNHFLSPLANKKTLSQVQATLLTPSDLNPKINLISQAPTRLQGRPDGIIQLQFVSHIARTGTETGRKGSRRADLPSIRSRDEANEGDWVWKEILGDQFPRIMAQARPIRAAWMAISKGIGAPGCMKNILEIQKMQESRTTQL